MSVKLRFEYPAEGGVQRSRSFAGFSTFSGRRRTSSVQSSLRSKGTLAKSPRLPPSPSRFGSSIWGPQPDQVDRVFQVLRKGLKEYLQGHQTELDFLLSQQKDSKRNSRLAFLYDLEKEIRALERYVHRLEFHISKVEELYETYCIQWRLCQGVANMRRAFANFPSSRASRDSLLELNRNHRHSLEDMYIMEGELEILLGEMHIKMKGLIGFARLCPGDQYEVLIRLGRQKWKIRGKIRADDQQSWDEEEMVFLPHIHEHFEIKVTEVKGLASISVGIVTCETADFFTSRPQMMVVDITELGTIKLQLEVVWNPFDSGEVKPITSASSKLSVHSRKSSLYSWTPPNTPSFTEKYFITMVRQLHDSENSFSLSTRESRGVSLLSYLSDTSQTFVPSLFGGSEMLLSGGTLSDTQEDLAKSTLAASSSGDDWSPGPDTGPPTPKDPAPSVHHFATPDILKQNGTTNVSAEAAMEGQTVTDSGEPDPSSHGVNSRQRRAVAMAIARLLEQLETGLQENQRLDVEIKRLDKQVQHFKTILKNDLYLHKTSSAETLSVEEVLESFDFLSGDFSTEELHGLDNTQHRNTGVVDSKPQGKESSLTTGHCGLDYSLEIHLGISNIVLQQLKHSDSLLVQKELLDDLSLQLDILEKISKLSLEKKIDSVTAKDVFPKSQRQKGLLPFWDECTHSGSLFCCSAQLFVRTLRKCFIHKVKAKQPSQADTAFAQLLQQIQSSCRMIPALLYSTEHVTLFQLSNYLTRWGLTDLGEHISHLAREMHLLASLGGAKRMKALKKLKGKRISELLPLNHTLQLLAKLQMDANHKVSRTAGSCLCRACGCKAFRAKAITYYTEALRSSDKELQQASCLALKCLKAVESVDKVAELWRSADEELRNAARETVLSLGKKGQVAFQRVDQIDTELQDYIYKNPDTEITIL